MRVRVKSLNVRAHDDGETTAQDLLPAPESDSDERDAETITAALLAQARLSERERLVLDRRFRRDRTLQEIGDELGVSRERIRQVETKALRKLRLAARFSGLNAESAL